MIPGRAILVLAPTHTAEVWLTSLHSQVYWGIVAVLLLFDAASHAGRTRRFLRRALLLLAGLSSVYAVLLFPAFALRALTQRRERAGDLAMLGLALAVQICITASFASSDSMNQKRFSGIDAHVVASAARFQIAGALLGGPVTKTLFKHAGEPAGLALVTLLVASTIAIIAIDRRRRRTSILADMRVQLFVAFASLFVATSLTAFEGRPDGRYAVVSGWVLLLFVLACIPASPRSPRAWIAALLLSFALGAGCLDYRSDPRLRCDAATSRWLDEVAEWRRDPQHRLEICPDTWSIRLRRQ